MITLILFSISMLVGCYAAGCIPLAFNLSPNKLRYLSIFGAGLLIGTALTVIIPEGVHSMYTMSEGQKEFLPKSSELKANRKLMINDPKIREVNIEPIVDHMKLENQAAGKLVHVHGGLEKEQKTTNIHGHNHVDNSIHTKIGLALITGFIFMLIIDHFSSMFTRSRGTDLENSDSKKRSKSIPATIGLVVHAAADGIALGAASSTSHLQLEVIIFIAIMLHKAPAAFGLVSFLLNDNVDRQKIRRLLLVFSLAAPVMAIITYLCLNEQAKEHLQHVNATGIALLFSAGTFLYVATIHVLSDLSHRSSKSTPNVLELNSELNGRPIISSIDHSSTGFSFPELVFIVAGSAFPLLLSIGHSHE